FISIDDNELHNLRKICDEIFGENNFIAQIIWERAYAPVNLKKHFSESHDFVICYARDISEAINLGLPRSDEADDRYSNPDNDPRGPWQSSDLSVGPPVEKNIYEIITPGGRKVMPPSGRSWLYTREIFNKLRSDNRIWFGENENNVPRVKRFLVDVKDTVTPMTIWAYKEVGHSQSASQALKRLFDDKAVFTYPKPVDYIKRMAQLYTKDDDIILDFFAGSSTTAHAVMKLNAEDGGNRKFIMVQLPEPTEKDSEAYIAGYKNISDIGKERIRRAGDQIRKDLEKRYNEADIMERENIKDPEELDIGFKVLKLDTSNIKEWNPGIYDNLQLAIEDSLNPYIEGRTEEDVVFEMMLKMGIDLTHPIEEHKIEQGTIYSIGFGSLMIYLSKNADIGVARKMVEIKKEYDPEIWRVIFRDEGFKSDKDKTNIKETLKAAGLMDEGFLSL
ncbi:MAG: site-specific DNA-methyltransferase, partial [Clostridiales bacterium]|nr:site-specific DNA-methyltransferase [Clostridiales bacterium]